MRCRPTCRGGSCQSAENSSMEGWQPSRGCDTRSSGRGFWALCASRIHLRDCRRQVFDPVAPRGWSLAVLRTAQGTRKGHGCLAKRLGYACGLRGRCSSRRGWNLRGPLLDLHLPKACADCGHLPTIRGGSSRLARPLLRWRGGSPCPQPRWLPRDAACNPPPRRGADYSHPLAWRAGCMGQQQGCEGRGRRDLPKSHLHRAASRLCEALLAE
ncbi:unnamed protein product [Symbiodinium necroappetens]|uniref:Uncharacterized protein n=1 Tax=Symbiodinium necroappetens TaxID=1628268 RepID=A0A813BW71_9DINO|nr:unnamed protein product [Symbiodinium necroappetens]